MRTFLLGWCGISIVLLACAGPTPRNDIARGSRAPTPARASASAFSSEQQSQQVAPAPLASERSQRASPKLRPRTAPQDDRRRLRACATTPEQAAKARRAALREARWFGRITPLKTSFTFYPVVVHGFRSTLQVVETMDAALYEVEECLKNAKGAGWRTRGAVTVRLEVDHCGNVVKALPETDEQLDHRYLACIIAVYDDLVFAPIQEDNDDIITRAHLFP